MRVGFFSRKIPLLWRSCFCVERIQQELGGFAMGTMTAAEVVKRSVSLAGHIRSRGIELRRHGSRDLAGLCPFHSDKTPSLIVSESKGVFHCLGCGAKGSVIDFAMRLDNIGFKEALSALGGGAGLSGAAEPPSASSSAPLSAPLSAGELSPGRAAELLEKAVVFHEKAFAASAEGRAYLESRGLTDAGLLARRRVGFGDGSLSGALPSSGAVLEDLRALGVILEGGRERFHGCVVFPVLDADGGIATLCGRSVEGRRHVLLPGRPSGLFNMSSAKSSSEVILVESVIDALSLEMAGVRNAVAIQGVNGFSECDAKALKSLGVKRIVLMLDGDDPGRRAAGGLSKWLSGEFAVATIQLPEGHDPNSLLVERGAPALAALVSSSLAVPPRPAPSSSPSSPSVQRGGRIAAVYGLRRYEVLGLERSSRSLKATVRVEKGGKLHVDTLDLNSARHRRQLCQDLCLAFEEAPETVESDLGKLLRLCEESAAAIGSADGAGAVAEPVAPPMSEAERLEAEAFGKSPDLVGRIMSDFERCGLVGEEPNKLLCYLAMTSRKMDGPLSVLILSSSGAGKTALQDAALGFCPPEDLVKLTSLSGRALFYKDRLSLKHKILAIEECAGAGEASYAIRNLISADGLTSEVATRDPATGRLTTVSNTVEGPTAVFCTTTDPEVDPETRSRFLVTGIDESRAQTRRILEFQRRRRGADGLVEDAGAESVRALHRNFQRLLRPLRVVNPLAAGFFYEDDRLQGRRSQPQYLDLVNAVAFLRQMGKEVKTRPSNDKAVEYIEVDAEDVALANKVALEVLGRSLDELSIPARNLLDLVGRMVEGRLGPLRAAAAPAAPARKSDIPFTRRDLREFTGWTQTRLRTHLKELLDFEYVVLDGGGNGRTLQTYRLVHDGQGKDGGRFVPGLASQGQP